MAQWEEVALEKMCAAEKRGGRVRMAALIFGTAVYYLGSWPEGVPWLAKLILLLGWIYVPFVYFFEPYRKFSILRTSYFITFTDAVLITLWVWATGGFYSPFYLLFYVSVAAVAFRYNYKETLFASAVYGGAYTGIVFAAGQLPGHEMDLISRVGFLMLVGMESGLLAYESHEQIRAKTQMRAMAQALQKEILQREAMEEQRLQAHAELEKRVIERTQQLAHANEELRQEIQKREEAERKQAYLAAIVNSSEDAIVGKTLRGTIISWNKGAEDLYGFTAGEAIGKNMSMLAPPDRQGEVFLLLDRIKKGECIKPFDTVRLHKKGYRIEIALSVSPVYDSSGTIIGASAIGRDISDRKEIERRLSQTASRLARSNKELEEFAYVVSHDLQEPLRMIASYAELLTQRYQNRLDPNANKFIGYMVEGAHRMQTLIQALLKYARVDRAEMIFEPTDLNEIWKHVLEDLGRSVQESGAIVTQDPLPTLPVVPSQIEQLLQNLLGNALKFRGKDKLHVRLSALQNSEQWQLSVEDNGIGLDPQYANRIFLMFQRLHAQSEYPGTGIGLAICKKIVERHSGQIWVESSPGKGAKFCFTLPIHQEDAHAKQTVRSMVG